MLGSSISFQHTWWKQTEECFQHRRHEMEFPRSARKQPRVCREKTKHDTGSSRATDFKPEPTWFPNDRIFFSRQRCVLILTNISIQHIIMDKKEIGKQSVVSPTLDEIKDGKISIVSSKVENTSTVISIGAFRPYKFSLRPYPWSHSHRQKELFSEVVL